MSASVCQWVWLHVAKPWDYIRLTYYTWPDDLRCGIDRRDCHDQPDAPMVWLDGAPKKLLKAFCETNIG